MCARKRVSQLCRISLPNALSERVTRLSLKPLFSLSFLLSSPLQCLIIRGNNIGRVGTIVSHEHHPASYDIIHIKDSRGNEFSTRLQNVFIIGTGNQAAITLPKNKGVRSTVIEEREKKLSKEVSAEKKKATSS